jgi:radical SAM superfamily enzyme YgiQ (UPF0313 family)
MKIRVIYPKFNKFLEDHPKLNKALKEHVVGDYTMPPSLALPILAALTPPDIEVNLTDDNGGQTIDFDEKVDLVAISCFTPQAERAYTIADEYRKRKTPVAMGGIHPSMRPEEAHLHADAVCVGEGETVWPLILHDVKNGCLKEYYYPEKEYNLADFPIPKREIFSHEKYKWEAHLVLTMRGCPVNCAGCPIPAKEGPMFRFRPISNIIEDIKQMPYKEFYFTDDTIMLPGKKNHKFLMNLMEKTTGLDVKIFLASTMMMLNDFNFYTKLKAGGAASIYTIFGFDRVSKKLMSPECTPQEWRESIDLVRAIEDNGIHLFASFGIGFDDQDRGVVDRILAFAAQARIDLAEFYIVTPFPGTPFGIQCEKENRILHRNYTSWNHGNVVFKPLHWTEEELMKDFYRLWDEFYRDKDPKQTIRTFDVKEF